MSLLAVRRDGNWIGCIDFGTALSKAALVKRMSTSRFLIVAIAAANACVSPPWVVDSRKTRGLSVWSRPPRRIYSRLPASAETEKPLPSDLPKVERSGTMS
jgi:hypothetical protein